MPAIPVGAKLAAIRAFRDPIVTPEATVRESPSVSFADLVRMLGEGIADAQASLDRTSAELVQELANTKVQVVPEVKEVVDADGKVTFEQAKPQEVSLLSIGVMPAFYQFSQSTVEVAMDVKIVEGEKESGTGKRLFGLFAGTAELRAERTLNREVTAHSKLTATLVPVPRPLRIEPSRPTTTPGP
jgi:hypothetical protein